MWLPLRLQQQLLPTPLLSQRGSRAGRVHSRLTVVNSSRDGWQLPRLALQLLLLVLWQQVLLRWQAGCLKGRTSRVPTTSSSRTSSKASLQQQ